MRIAKLLCKIGIHDDLSQAEYYKRGFGADGEVNVCARCGKITSWGKVIIPAYFKK